MAAEIIRDALDIPIPKAHVSANGLCYGRDGVYWALSAAAANAPDLRGTYAEVLSAAQAAGYRIIEEGLDGHGYHKAALEHTATAAEAERRQVEYARRWRDATPCFVRLGRLPADGLSRNHADGTAETGVSVYTALLSADGRARITVSHAAQSWGACGMSGERTAYLVTGEVVGIGSDGEPVMRNARLGRKVEIEAVDLV